MKKILSLVAIGILFLCFSSGVAYAGLAAADPAFPNQPNCDYQINFTGWVGCLPTFSVTYVCQ